MVLTCRQVQLTKNTQFNTIPKNMAEDLGLFLKQFAQFSQRKDLGTPKPYDGGYIFLRPEFIASLRNNELKRAIENFRKHVCIGMNCKLFAGNQNRTYNEIHSFQCLGFTENMQYHPVEDRLGIDVTLFTNWTATNTKKVLKKAACEPKILK